MLTSHVPTQLGTIKTIQALIGFWIPSMAGLLGYRPSQYVAQITVPRSHPNSPATQSRTRSLLNSSKQDNPAVVISNRTTKPKIKGPLDRDKSCSQVGATHEALLHLPCFSHSRLMRLEATITFREHISQNAHRPPDDVLKAFNPYKFVPGSNETEGIISLHSFWNHPQSQLPQPLHSESPSRTYKYYSVKLITESPPELY